MTLWSGSGLFVGAVVLLASGTLRAQVDSPLGSRNSFGVMAEYSNDSSHIILGDAVNVKLAAIGLQYQRRLIANRKLVLSYAMEFRPVILESIPTVTFTTVETLPIPATYTDPPQLTTKCVASAEPFELTDPLTGVVTAGTTYTSCGRQTIYAQGLSPLVSSSTYGRGHGCSRSSARTKATSSPRSPCPRPMRVRSILTSRSALDWSTTAADATRSASSFKCSTTPTRTPPPPIPEWTTA
jgi:hypothetical protein